MSDVVDLGEWWTCFGCKKVFPIIKHSPFAGYLGTDNNRRCSACDVRFIMSDHWEEKPMNTQAGCQGGHLASEPAKPRRMAWMAVHFDLFKQMCGGNFIAFFELREWAKLLANDGDWAEFKELSERVHKRIHECFLFPANSKVVLACPVHGFCKEEMHIQIECPDFRTVMESCTMPQVEAMYCRTDDLLGKTVTHFDGWCNDAAVVGDYKKPERPNTDRCSEELGHFAMPGATACYCGEVGQNMTTGKWAKIEAKYTFGGYFGGVLAEWNPSVLHHDVVPDEVAADTNDVETAVQQSKADAEEKKSSNRGYEFL